MSDNVVRLTHRQKRLNININQQTEVALARYCAEHDVSITEAVRRFAGVADFILQAMDDGQEVLFRKNGQTERVVFDL